MGVDYATTQVLLQVFDSYSMQCFSHSHFWIPIPIHFIPILILWPILFPFPVYPIPMHISTSDYSRWILESIVFSGRPSGHPASSPLSVNTYSAWRDQGRIKASADPGDVPNVDPFQSYNQLTG